MLLKTDTFAITKNHLDDIKLSPKGIEALKKEGYNEYFKLYDDDDNLYFEGYLHLENAENDEDSWDGGVFIPLDWAMMDSGCTYIKYRDAKTGKMEIL